MKEFGATDLVSHCKYNHRPPRDGVMDRQGPTEMLCT